MAPRRSARKQKAVTTVNHETEVPALKMVVPKSQRGQKKASAGASKPFELIAQASSLEDNNLSMKATNPGSNQLDLLPNGQVVNQDLPSLALDRASITDGRKSPDTEEPGEDPTCDSVNTIRPGSPPHSTHHYNTRPTNELHPAKRFGLEKRTKDAIMADAEQKRWEKEELLRRKQEELEAQQEKLNNKLAQLAALEERLKAEREAINGMVLDKGLSATVEIKDNSDVIEIVDAPVQAKKVIQSKLVLVFVLFVPDQASRPCVSEVEAS